MRVEFMEHELFEDGDPDAPSQIKDQNGDIVLGLCKICGAAEAELETPCTGPFSIAMLKAIAREAKTFIILRELAMKEGLKNPVTIQRRNMAYLELAGLLNIRGVKP